MSESSDSSQQLSATLAADLRRMAPIWGLIALAAFGSLMAIRYSGRSYLERGIYEQANSCEVARVHKHAAERTWRKFAAELTEANREAESSKGAFANDPRLTEAIERIESAIDLCERLPGAHSYRADFAWWQGDVARTHLHQGLEHVTLEEWDNALVELEAAFLEDPTELRASEGLLRVHLMRDDLERAAEFLETAPPAVLESTRGLQTLAYIAEQENDLLAAREYYRAALRQRPGDRTLILRFLRNHQLTDEAEAGADEAMEFLRTARAPEADPYHAVGLAYGDVGAYEKALDAINRALAIQPNSATLLMERAALLYELDRLPEARAASREALSRDPGYFARTVHAERFERLREDQ